MSYVNSWLDLEEAVVKFGVARAQILGWVEDGLVRAEEEGKGVVRINVDDLELKVQELTGI